MQPPAKKGVKSRPLPSATTPSRAQHVEPRLPHERDESSEPGAPINEDAKRVGKQAARDVARGLVDTGLGPVLQKLSAEHFGPPGTAAESAGVAPKAKAPRRRE